MADDAFQDYSFGTESAIFHYMQQKDFVNTKDPLKTHNLF